MAKWSTLKLHPAIIVARWRRLGRHILYPVFRHKAHLPVRNPGVWLLDLIFYCFDLFFLPEFYKALYFVIKPSIRFMSEEELNLARSIFLDGIVYRNVLIDNFSGRVSKRYGIAYVSFDLIHTWQSLRKDVFIHELMHVFQYQRFGSVYIIRALLAQWSKEAYDYGGLAGLAQAVADKKRLIDFNFEQQASIIEHFYELRERWGEEGMAEKWAPYRHYWHELLLLSQTNLPNK